MFQVTMVIILAHSCLQSSSGVWRIEEYENQLKHKHGTSEVWKIGTNVLNKYLRQSEAQFILPQN